MLVGIDPGHGGRDPGAVSHGLNEKDVVLKLGHFLKESLSNRGIRSLLLRDRDLTMDIPTRLKRASENNVTMILSLHANAFTEDRANGIETWYHNETDKILAKVIQNYLIGGTEQRDRGIKQSNQHGITRGFTPSVLIEVGFITHREERQLLTDDNYLKHLANLISEAVYHYQFEVSGIPKWIQIIRNSNLSNEEDWIQWVYSKMNEGTQNNDAGRFLDLFIEKIGGY